MAKKTNALLTDLSTADLKRLLAARERIDALEKDRARLAADLERVERELAQLLDGAQGGGGKPARRVAKRKTTAKPGRRATGKARRKTTKKTSAKKAAAKSAGGTTRRAGKKATKKAAKKTAKKATKKTATKTAKKAAAMKPKASAKQTARRTTKKAATRGPGKAAAGKRKTLEEVIVAVLRKRGGTLAFQDLKRAIVDGKLFATRSANFDNVLRRTLSTSSAVKRAGRGVYTVA